MDRSSGWKTGNEKQQISLCFIDAKQTSKTTSVCSAIDCLWSLFETLIVWMFSHAPCPLDAHSFSGWIWHLHQRPPEVLLQNTYYCLGSLLEPVLRMEWVSTSHDSSLLFNFHRKSCHSAVIWCVCVLVHASFHIHVWVHHINQALGYCFFPLIRASCLSVQQVSMTYRHSALAGEYTFCCLCFLYFHLGFSRDQQISI